MSDLHACILAEIERREAVVKAASPGPWHVGPDPDDRDSGEAVRDADLDVIAFAYTPGDDKHIALHDPADALRRYARDRKVLERHKPVERRDYGNDNWLACPRCGLDITYKPCTPLLDLAESLDIEAT